MNQHKDEEWVDQLISQAIDSGGPQFDPEKWKQKYPEEFQMIASRARQGAGGSSGRQASVWKTAMQSRITRLALPAAALIVLAVTRVEIGAVLPPSPHHPPPVPPPSPPPSPPPPAGRTRRQPTPASAAS